MKNPITLLREAQISHRNLLAEAKETLEAVGGCDHSVGICACELVRRIEHGEVVQKMLDEAVDSINRHAAGSLPS